MTQEMAPTQITLDRYLDELRATADKSRDEQIEALTRCRALAAQLKQPIPLGITKDGTIVYPAS